jgi:antitoxin VapB
MAEIYTAKQFKARNSQAVRLPTTIAFPPKTELTVTLEGDKIIVQPAKNTMANIPLLFSAPKNAAIDGKMIRPEFIETKRVTNSSQGNRRT